MQLLIKHPFILLQQTKTLYTSQGIDVNMRGRIQESGGILTGLLDNTGLIYV